MCNERKLIEQGQYKLVSDNTYYIVYKKCPMNTSNPDGLFFWQEIARSRYKTKRIMKYFG